MNFWWMELSSTYLKQEQGTNISSLEFLSEHLWLTPYYKLPLTSYLFFFLNHFIILLMHSNKKHNS